MKLAPARKRPGFALITVLLFSGIILMMVLALFLSVRGELFLSQSYRNQTSALYLAETGLWDAVSELELDPTWTAGFKDKPSPDGNGTYSVTFNTTNSGFKDFESVNNSDGSSSANYRGANYVPKGCASLVVTANVGGYKRELEALVRIGGGLYPAEAPIMASGRVDLRGSVKIDGRKGQADPEKVDADVHSNKEEQDADIIVWDGNGQARIEGKVSTVAPNASAIGSGITVGAGGVADDKQTGAARAPIPDVNVLAKIQGHKNAPGAVVGSGVTVLKPPSSTANDLYHSGDMNVQGDLVLDGVNLYVDGELHINGSVTGSGSIYVAKNTQLQGDARIASATPDTIALFSEGNVQLSGFDGTEYMESLGASNPQIKADWEQLSDSIQDYVNYLDTPGTAIPTPNMTKLNALSQEISGSGTFYEPVTVPGRRNNVTQSLINALAGQPDSTAKQRMTEKFADLNSLFYSYPDGSQIEAKALTDLAAGRISQGGFDAALDNFGNLTAAQKKDAKSMMTGYVSGIDYDHLGSAYFQGMIFTHGSIYTDAEVTVQGALAAYNNGSQSPTTINGENVNPGDLVLQPLTRISYIEEFFKPKDAGGGVGAAGVQLLLWMGR